MAEPDGNGNGDGDGRDDRPASGVYPLGAAEQHELTETALSHMDAMKQYVELQSDQALHPPTQCPASGLFGSLRIGSRKSKMALIQASSVAAALFKVHHGFSFPISTHAVQGDVDKTTPFLQFAAKPGKSSADVSKSLWTKEIEERLLAGDIDIIVHSLKDVPTALPEGCAIGVFPHRNDPTDALVVKTGLPYRSLEDLPSGSVVGTSSVRRTAQLKHFCPHLLVQECRGNVDSRIAKLDASDSPYTAIVVATSGLERLNLEHRITARLSAPTFLHAVGQGSLGIEIRSNDTKTLELIKPIDHWPTRVRCLAERSLLRYLQGGCSAPIAVLSSLHSGSVDSSVTTDGQAGVLHLIGTLLHPQGGVEIRAHHSGLVKTDVDAEAVGIIVAKRILELGGGALLALVKTPEGLPAPSTTSST
ncbi:MAG: hypothetical protein M1819_000496 [Sarea resinae]|nr:MAG: hypothetical protein M1819_000496 [Sarea resinae]